MPSARLPALLAALLLVAVCVVDVLISVGVPVWKAIYFARLRTSGSVPVDVGIWSLCTSSGHCTPASVGLNWVPSRLDQTPAPNGNVLIKGLTSALILHPIAAGLAALQACFTLCTFFRPGRSGWMCASVVGTLLSCLVTLGALGVSLAVVLLARSRYTGTVSFGPALWMSVGASAGAVLAVLAAIWAAGMSMLDDSTNYASPEAGYTFTADQDVRWSNPSAMVSKETGHGQEMDHLPHTSEALGATSRTQLNPAPADGYAYDTGYNTYPDTYNTYYPAATPLAAPVAPAPTPGNWDVNGYVNPNTYWNDQHPTGQLEQSAHDHANGFVPGGIYNAHGQEPQTGTAYAAPNAMEQAASRGEYSADAEGTQYGMAYGYPTGREPNSYDSGYAYQDYGAAYEPAAQQHQRDSVPPTPMSGSEVGAITFGRPASPQENQARAQDAYARVAHTVSTSRAHRLAPAEESSQAAWDAPQQSLPGYSSSARQDEEQLDYTVHDRRKN